MQIELRIRNVNLAESLQRYVEGRLRHQLRHLGNRFGRVKVWLSDVNGPRGGPDKQCRISLELTRVGTITAEDTHPHLHVCISRAAKRPPA
jgi:ribosome hibernation promoting factor